MSGNCALCVEHHRKTAATNKSLNQQARLEAMKAGRPVPPKQEFDDKPPCQKCPKYALYPDGFGLMPENQLAVKLYHMAQSEQRVCTMAGAFLLRTLNVQDAIAVLDEYQEHFPTWLHRQRMLEMMMGLDRVATEVISKKEQVERDRAEMAAKQRPKQERPQR